MQKKENYFCEFIRFLKSHGIKEGDVVYIGSDVSGILLGARRELNITTRDEQRAFLDELIDAIQNAVGGTGTLLFPNYSWTFCKGNTFDYHTTPGEVGVLNNYILNNRKDFFRTRHPIYNFMVWGRDAKRLQQMDNQDSWSKDSPFGYLHEMHAKQVNLDVPFNKCITFQHYVEQCIDAPYRYKKMFAGNYIDDRGIHSERFYSMYVRDLNISSSPNLPEDFFTNAGVAEAHFFHGYKVIFMELYQIFEHIKRDLIDNGGRNIYHFDNYEPVWDGKKTHCDEIKISEKQIIQIKGGF